MKINCLGDSITEGWGLPNPSRQSFPALLQEAFPNHQFVNYGSAGAMVQPFGGYGYEDTLPYHVASQNPGDLSLFLLGSNDGFSYSPYFKSEYKRLAESIHKPLILVTPPKMGLEGTALEKIRQDILDVGKELNLPVLDLYTASDPSWLAEDHVHPTPEGQEKIADFLYRELQPYLS